MNTLAAVALLSLASTVHAANPPIDPCDHGAVGDGVADDTSAIQAALNAAAESSHIVSLQPGNYRIGAMLDIPHGVTLTGAVTRWEDGSTGIIVEEPGFSAVRLNNHSTVRGLRFSYPNNRLGAEPTEYPPTVLMVGINPSVEQIVFDGAYVGVSPPPEGANTGQSLFRDLTGFVHKTGIRLDGIKDIARIEDVHWFVPGAGGTGGWFRTNRVGFEFGSVDGIIMSQCFMIGGKTFLHQQATNGQGNSVHSLGIHVTQCWTEAVKYGFLIEGTCGLTLSDTQIYVSQADGIGIAMRMPHLYYHSTITNTQVRLDGNPDSAIGIEYAPTDDHSRNHLMVSSCQVVESLIGIRLGAQARRVILRGNHLLGYESAIEIAEGADQLIIKDNILAAPTPIADESGDAATKVIADNL